MMERTIEATVRDLSTLGQAPYIDGDVIQQKWHGGFIFLAYVTAFIGSYSAIRVLEHGLWRSEEERENATCKYSSGPRHYENSDNSPLLLCGLFLQCSPGTPDLQLPLCWDLVQFGPCTLLGCRQWN